MDWIMLAVAVAIVAAASLIIMRGCDSFEDASDYLGRKMPPGVRGATINAVGSSLPELLTTFILLFLFLDEDGYSGGIATCAGSAVFNAVIIPALCIGAVLWFGVKRRGGGIERVKAITVGRPTIVRDGIFFVAAEILLITLLSGSTMRWWMGGALMGVYVLYFGYLMFQYKRGVIDLDDDGDDDDEDDGGESTVLGALWRLEFNQLFFGGRRLSTGRAWVVLTASVAVIAAGCYALSWAVVEAAHALNVPLYFTTVILAAAATSVPDTVLSVKDAMKGSYDDAVSNALGSNIFDITVALGFPLLCYGLVHGDVHLASTSGSAADVQLLRVALLVVTVFVMALFLIGTRMGRVKAALLMLIYAAWTLFIIGRAVEWEWLVRLTG